MTEINTVNTVDKTIVVYANDNVNNSVVNDYNNSVFNSLSSGDPANGVSGGYRWGAHHANKPCLTGKRRKPVMRHSPPLE